MPARYRTTLKLTATGNLGFFLLIVRVWLPNESHIITKLISALEREEGFPILPQLQICIFIGKRVTSTGPHIWFIGSGSVALTAT